MSDRAELGRLFLELRSLCQEGVAMRMYSLFDRKMREYGAIVLGSNDESIVRALREMLGSSASTMAKYPGDFDLMCLGVFDPETGVIGAEIPRLVVNVEDISNAER